MPVPFGFGVSDFVAVGQLAWKIYQSCMHKDPPYNLPINRLSGQQAPEVFRTISETVQSLHCVLEEAADTQISQPLPHRKQARLETILKGCISVLADLQYIVQKYHSLGTEEKKSWDRFRLGNEDIAEIRERLRDNVLLLTAFRRYDTDGQTVPDS